LVRPIEKEAGLFGMGKKAGFDEDRGDLRNPQKVEVVSLLGKPGRS